MLHQSGLSASTARHAVDLRRLPWIKRLPADYAFDFPRLDEFFAGDPTDPVAWRDTIGRTQRHERKHEAVASLVQAQQRRRGAPVEAAAAAAILRNPRAVAIVTGQQASLFGGPLFTLLKALSAIQLAERVRREHHVPTVAVFWVDAEDHDWDEVKACGVLDGELNSRSVALGDPPGARGESIGRIRFGQNVDAAVAELEALLQPTEFTAQLVQMLRHAYRAGAGVAEAFAQWLEATLGPRGLIVYDASDPVAKPLVADVFEREVEFAGATHRLAAEAGAALEARGYHAQATPQDGGLALFHVGGGRESIRTRDDGFLIGNRAASQAELLADVRRAPIDFSPNVLLRPLVQDTLFPTACYVAGPSELAYLGQLKNVYSAFGIPMPLVQQRATATLLDSNATRFLAKHELPLESLRAQDEAALNELLEAALPPGVEAALQDAKRALADRMAALVHEVPQIDTTLEGAARSTLARMQDDLDKLNAKIIQATKRKNDTLRRQFHHAQAQAFPGGQPQERAIGFVYFLNKYGPTLVDRLCDELPLEMGMHWVLTL